MNIETLKFPLGKFTVPQSYTHNLIHDWIEEIASFPERLFAITENLTNEQLQWKYRPGGWAIKQVVHHCADSHMNSFTRFKLALTEETPKIRPYFEDLWAELPDGLSNDLSLSLKILEGLHAKWVYLLKSLSESQLKCEFMHPEHGTVFNLQETIGSYAWHSNHHLAHIKLALEAQGKYN